MHPLSHQTNNYDLVGDDKTTEITTADFFLIDPDESRRNTETNSILNHRILRAKLCCLFDISYDQKKKKGLHKFLASTLF